VSDDCQPDWIDTWEKAPDLSPMCEGQARQCRALNARGAEREALTPLREDTSMTVNIFQSMLRNAH